MGCCQKRYASVEVPPVSVRLPIQWPLSPSVTSVTIAPIDYVYVYRYTFIPRHFIVRAVYLMQSLRLDLDIWGGQDI